MKKNDVLQIKISLMHIKPAIWRRFQVPGRYTLGDLHKVIQILMSWEDYHLHKFDILGEFYGPPVQDIDLFGEDIDEAKVSLSEVLTKEKLQFLYEYDFGDGWEHKLVVEKIMVPEAGVSYPRCLGGKRSGPPEDSGGPWGYEDFLSAYTNPGSEDHELVMDWLGPGFDPELFPLDLINARLTDLAESKGSLST